jgi:hypothetical protein
MAAPPRTTPSWLGHLGAPRVGLTTPAAQPAPATLDLPGSWRGVMTALGVGLPHGLNRATNAAAALHRRVSRRG